MTGQPEPHLAPTKPGTLLIAAALAALVGWWLVSQFYGETLPRLTLLPSVTLILLAIGEGATARITKSRIDRRPGTEPVEPLVVARLAALAKASSLAGALLGGLYGGMLGWAYFQRDWLAAASEAITPSVVGLVSSAMLVGAGLWLESACKIPKGPEDGGDADDPPRPAV